MSENNKSREEVNDLVRKNLIFDFSKTGEEELKKSSSAFDEDVPERCKTPGPPSPTMYDQLMSERTPEKNKGNDEKIYESPTYYPTSPTGGESKSNEDVYQRTNVGRSMDVVRDAPSYHTGAALTYDGVLRNFDNDFKIDGLRIVQTKGRGGRTAVEKKVIALKFRNEELMFRFDSLRVRYNVKPVNIMKNDPSKQPIYKVFITFGLPEVHGKPSEHEGQLETLSRFLGMISQKCKKWIMDSLSGKIPGQKVLTEEELENLTKKGITFDKMFFDLRRKNKDSPGYTFSAELPFGQKKTPILRGGFFEMVDGRPQHNKYFKMGDLEKMIPGTLISGFISIKEIWISGKAIGFNTRFVEQMCVKYPAEKVFMGSFDGMVPMMNVTTMDILNERSMSSYKKENNSEKNKKIDYSRSFFK